MDADIQVLCNMDLKFDPTWAENLLKCFERHPEAGSIASLVMEKSGVVNAVGVQFGPDLFAKNEASGLNIADADVREKEVFGCYGAVMSFRKTAAEAAGKMDASFFLFFEETEWYFRHNLAGYKTIFCPEAKVYHERSMTTVRYSPRKLFYSERNRLRTAVRLLPAGDVLKLPVRGFVRYLNMAKGGVPGQSGDGKKLSKIAICGALAKAWLQALTMLPEELVLRKKYRKTVGAVGPKVREILKTYPISE
jgi:GT2 family glycosyltransferase